MKERMVEVESGRLQGIFGYDPRITVFKGVHNKLEVLKNFRGSTNFDDCKDFVKESLEKADFRILSDDEYDFGKRKKRHGGVIKISDEEYERLKRAIV